MKSKVLSNSIFATLLKISFMLVLAPSVLAAKPFFGSVNYGGSFNSLEAEDEKTYRHGVYLNLGYRMASNLSLFTSFGYQFRTVDESVYRDNNRDSFFEFGDTRFGLNYGLDFKRSFLNNLNYGFVIQVPTSEFSRYENLRFGLSLNQSGTVFSWRDFSFSHNLFGKYLSNRYEFSPVSNQLNTGFVYGGGLNLGFKITQEILFRAGISGNFVRYLDGSSDFNFGNTATVSYQLNKLNIFVSLINNSYPDLKSFSLNYYDQYRRIVSAGLSYAF